MIQNLVFPDGVVFDVKKREYLTKNKNLIFACIEDIAKETEGQKKGQIRNKSDLSSLVAKNLQNYNLKQFVNDANRVLHVYNFLEGNI